MLFKNSNNKSSEHVSLPKNFLGYFFLNYFTYFIIPADKNSPCVGLCYHNKLQALEENNDDYSRGWPLNSKDFVDQPPCVGLCQMFRELNIPNPFHRYQHTGTKPTPRPTPQSTLRPS